MAKDHRRLAEEVAQRILLDDPSFLKEIVERVLQELLEAENERARRRVPGFLESCRRRIRTTNTLARFNQNIERRTKVGGFPQPRVVPASRDGFVGGRGLEKWVTGRRYLDKEELCEHWRLEELLIDSEEAMIMEQ
jgi:hypothetical protein